jgi:hypothetical protein
MKRTTQPRRRKNPRGVLDADNRKQTVGLHQTLD